MKTLLTIILSLCLLVSGFVPAIRVITSPMAARPVQTASEQKTKPDKPVTLRCRVTVYTPYDDGSQWGYETATGAKSQHLMTCAVDPSVIPLGSVIRVDGADEELYLTAVDTGSAVKGEHIDIFYDGTIPASEEWAESFSGEWADVTIYPKGANN